MREKPKELHEDGLIHFKNGYTIFRDFSGLYEATKYDLRNYCERDKLALRIAYLTSKTWLRNQDPRVEWSSIHGCPKRTGEHSAWGIGKPKLFCLTERITSMLRRKYTAEPEKLKDLVTECSLSEKDFDTLIRHSREKELYFSTTTEKEVEECAMIRNEWKDYYLRRTVDKHKDGVNDALTLGRLYLSDIAKKAYSDLTGKSWNKDESFVEKVSRAIDLHVASQFLEGRQLVRAGIGHMEIYKAMFRCGYL